MVDVVRSGARAPTRGSFSLSQLLWAREAGVFLALLALCLFLTFATGGFLTSLNLLNVGRQISLLGIMAVGMTFVLIAGEVDLSVGSTYAFCGLASGMLICAGWPLYRRGRPRRGRGLRHRPDQRPAFDLWPLAFADRDAWHVEHGARRGADFDERRARHSQCPQRRVRKRAQRLRVHGAGLSLRRRSDAARFLRHRRGDRVVHPVDDELWLSHFRRRRQRQGGARIGHSCQRGEDLGLHPDGRSRGVRGHSEPRLSAERAGRPDRPRPRTRRDRRNHRWRAPRCRAARERSWARFSACSSSA